MMKQLSLFLFLLVINSAFGQSTSPLNVVNDQFNLSWLLPETTKEVNQYDKLELGIRLSDEVDDKINQFIKNNSTGLNPYNPKDINIELEFVSPSYKQQKVYAFYYKEYEQARTMWVEKTTAYNWRVRFSPDEVGRWKFLLKVFVRGSELGSMGAKFMCVKSDHKGVIQRNYNGDETDRYLYLSETKETFYTIGHNIAHSAYYKLTPEKANRHKKWLRQLAENGGNFFRLELGAPNGLPDWNNYQDYTSKMPQMWEFDNLTELARELNLYFILFRHHTEVMKGEDWDVACWENNPYNKGFSLEGRRGYFENRKIIEWQKNALRYIFSRWGYNTSFAFYEYQEIDHWIKELKKEEGINDEQAIRAFTRWYVGQKNYIKLDLGYDKLFINTYAVTPDLEYNPKNRGLFANSDVIGFHKYGQDKDINYNNRYETAVKLFKNWNKPFFIEEMGLGAGGSTDYLPLYKCSDVEFHNSVWATSFMGSAGTRMNWWWDRGIHDLEYYKVYNAVADFFKTENLIEGKYTPQKWRNTLSLNRAKIENYAMVNDSKTKVLGWVHNATHYWRNMSESCLNELTENGVFSEQFQLEDGYVLGKNKGTDFSGKKDAYTDKGGVQIIDNKTFEVNGLKAGGLFSKKKWYRIAYFSSVDGKEIKSENLNSNIWGKLKPKFPDGEYQDYAYKISFIGEGRKVP